MTFQIFESLKSYLVMPMIICPHGLLHCAPPPSPCFKQPWGKWQKITSYFFENVKKKTIFQKNFPLRIVSFVRNSTAPWVFFWPGKAGGGGLTLPGRGGCHYPRAGRFGAGHYQSSTTSEAGLSFCPLEMNKQTNNKQRPGPKPGPKSAAGSDALNLIFTQSLPSFFPHG